MVAVAVVAIAGNQSNCLAACSCPVRLSSQRHPNTELFAERIELTRFIIDLGLQQFTEERAHPGA